MARNIAGTPSEQIGRNYAATARVALGSLTAMTADGLSGRLLLVHGPPGTGKTTALRALARAWHGWCAVEVVVDPDKLYTDSGYLTGVLLAASEDGEEDDDKGRWRLLVL